MRKDGADFQIWLTRKFGRARRPRTTRLRDGEVFYYGKNGSLRNETESVSHLTRPHGTRGRLYGFAPTRVLGLQIGTRCVGREDLNRPHFG